MELTTPFGIIEYSFSLEKNKISAVQRALDWCKSILENTRWIPVIHEGNISLQRTINQHTIDLFPLEAARLDLGLDSRFRINHLAIQLNNQNVCVQSMDTHPRPLHTDMVASMILLFGQDDVNPELVPKTLHCVLTEDQRALLPKTQRGSYTPGQPSTTGREFIPETRILEIFGQQDDSRFYVQFEKRDGTLRNMVARIGFLAGGNSDQHHASANYGLRYNPSDYHLQPVTDVEIEQNRLLATDRVTHITFGGQTIRTSSAE